MINSSIQWTDHTWNIARGCTKKNEDCMFCYMMRDSMGGTRYIGNKVVRTKTVFNLPDKIKTKGAKLFVSSLTDWCHEDIDNYRHEMWAIIRRNPHLVFQMLTKRWERLAECLPEDWGDGYPNVWLGISAGSQKRYDEAMPYFRPIKAKVKWVSLEPLHKSITNLALKENGIQWVVAGGESGNSNGKWKFRKCEIIWLLDIKLQCHLAGVPIFMKQLGTHLSKKLELNDRHGGVMEEWPSTLQVRQFPTAA